MKLHAIGWTLRIAGTLAAAGALTHFVVAQALPPPLEWGETGKANWDSVTLGGASVSGNDAAFQRRAQTDAQSFGGIDTLHLLNSVGTNATLKVDGKALWGSGEYRLVVRYDNDAAGTYLEGGFKQSRVFYDGSGGYSPLGDVWINLYDDDLAIDRGEFWLEGGLTRGNWSGTVRYSHLYRTGMKDSTSWADSGLPGTTRNIVPSFYNIDEKRDIITADVKYESESLSGGGGLRYEKNKIDDDRNEHRSPGESSDRYITQHDRSDSDLFAMHAYVQSHQGEKLTLTGSAYHTRIDTNLSGSRIYGASYDPVLTSNYPGRGSHDEGFVDLAGDSNWHQYVLNGNALYLPGKDWRVSTSLRYENQSQDVMSEFIGTAGGVESEDAKGISSRNYDESYETVDVTYRGIANWVLGAKVELSQGNGDLGEDLIDLETGDSTLARDTAFDRDYYKYELSARWYPSMNCNFAAGVYRKIQDNDYNTSIDPTTSASDRYPAYITFQKFSTDDLYVRGTVRPASEFALTGRYDYQQTDIDSTEGDLGEVLAGERTTHIIAATLTWTPQSFVAVQASMNYVYDEFIAGTARTPSPLAHAVGRIDNNYHTGSLGVFFAVNENTDVQVDATLYRADNYRDVTDVTQPFGADAKDHSVGATLTRRVTTDLRWSVRYAYEKYSDFTSGGNNDFTANVLYGRVQYRF